MRYASPTNFNHSTGTCRGLQSDDGRHPPGRYPLAVKLGTITPHGADVYSYAPDEDDMVTDPLLGDHLAHWGINMLQVSVHV